MKENLKLGFRLFIITAVAGLFLGMANEVTKETIAKNSMLDKSDLQYVIAESDGFEVINIDKKSEDDVVKEAFKALNGSETAGYVVKVSPKGYKGPIDMIVGIKNDGKLGGIKILSQGETPGLGARVEEEGFMDKFKGLDTKEDIKVVKTETTNSSEVQGVTGATISSNAVVTGVNEALKFYKENILGEEVKENNEPNIEALGLKGELQLKEVSLKDGVTKVLEVSEGGYVICGEIDGIHAPNKINFAVGISKDGKVSGLQILSHKETPGLGDLIEKEDFTGQFKNLKASEKVSVDTITGSTISSQAVIDGVTNVLKFYNENLK